MGGSFWQDVRYSFRNWRRAPIAIGSAILALGLGIGVVVAVFSVVNAVLLRPLPFEDPERLISLWESIPDQNRDGIRTSVGDFFDWRERSRAFEDLSGFFRWKSTLASDAEPQRVWVGYVSARFFEMLGAQPVHGRTFADEENTPDAEKVAILSHGLWESSFGGDPEVIGRLIRLDDVAHTIVGVMEPGFDHPGDIGVWTPLGMDADSFPRNFYFLVVLGRLAPGVEVAQARSEMEAIAVALEEQYPKTNTGRRVSLVPLREGMVGEVRPALWMLFGAVVLILAIACANVASLLVARATARRSEVAVRTSLGATRSRLLRQGLTESLVLGLASGGAGVLTALVLIRLMIRFGPSRVPRLAEASLDPGVLLFALGISLLTGLTCGLAPALQSSKPDLAGWLKVTGSASRTRSGRRLLDALVMVEVALAFTLLIGAGLLLRSFWGLLAVDLGFEPSRVVTVEVELPLARYEEDHQPRAFFRDLMTRVDSLPGVRSAAAAYFLPLSGKGISSEYRIEGGPARPDGQELEAVVWPVTPGYTETLEIDLLRGRRFTWSDDIDAPPVILVSETFAREHWPDGGALGQRVIFSAEFGEDTGVLPRASREIVGVVADVKYRQPDAPPPPVIYFPQSQSDWRSMTLVARSSADDPLALVPALRAEIRDLDPALAVSGIQTLAQVVATSRAQPRFSALLLSILAGVGLILAAVGVFGITAYSMTERKQEIAIRMTLGARPRSILVQNLRRIATLTAISLAVGVTGSLVLSRWISAQLFGIAGHDPVTYATVFLVLGGMTCLAGYLPAQRASQLDPALTLRRE